MGRSLGRTIATAQEAYPNGRMRPNPTESSANRGNPSSGPDTAKDGESPGTHAALRPTATLQPALL